MVYLKLGSLEVDWGKNNALTLHGALYQEGDITEVPDEYVSESGEPFVEMHRGASKRLGQILPRLELLGHSLATTRNEFESLRKQVFNGLKVSFEEVADALKHVDVDAAAVDYHTDFEYGEFFARQLCDRLGVGGGKLSRDERYDLGRVMESLHPYSVLRLFAENPTNLTKPVTWHFHDVVEGGWVAARTIEQDIGNVRRFLIVTEGSSDAHILRHALKLLRQETADFFTFVDMEQGYPFTGTGNVHNFCKGLVAIGIENRVVVLYDNDLEGALRCTETNRLALPANMRVTKLPALPELTAIATIGPDGLGIANINGRAAAIECYLDCSYGDARPARVRWSSYSEKADAYQGALEDKQLYAKRFLELRSADPDYDFSKVSAVLDHLFNICFEVAEQAKVLDSVGHDLI